MKQKAYVIRLIYKEYIGYFAYDARFVPIDHPDVYIFSDKAEAKYHLRMLKYESNYSDGKLKIVRLRRTNNERRKTMEYKHINDCWNALAACKSIEELVKTMGEFPNKFGPWMISGMDSDGLEITNYYFDEQMESDEEDSEYYCFEDLMLDEERSFWSYIINVITTKTNGEWDVLCSAPTLEAAKKLADDLVKYVRFGDFKVYNAEVIYRPEDESDPESDEIVYTVEEGGE